MSHLFFRRAASTAWRRSASRPARRRALPARGAMARAPRRPRAAVRVPLVITAPRARPRPSLVRPDSGAAPRRRPALRIHARATFVRRARRRRPAPVSVRLAPFALQAAPLASPCRARPGTRARSPGRPWRRRLAVPPDSTAQRDPRCPICRPMRVLLAHFARAAMQRRRRAPVVLIAARPSYRRPPRSAWRAPGVRSAAARPSNAPLGTIAQPTAPS